MRKDNPIDKPITVSLFGTAASATLMAAFTNNNRFLDVAYEIDTRGANKYERPYRQHVV